jgi:hypothetical protein
LERGGDLGARRRDHRGEGGAGEGGDLLGFVLGESLDLGGRNFGGLDRAGADCREQGDGAVLAGRTESRAESRAGSGLRFRWRADATTPVDLSDSDRQRLSSSPARESGELTMSGAHGASGVELASDGAGLVEVRRRFLERCAAGGRVGSGASAESALLALL